MDKKFKKYRKQEAFKVPEGYFENFALRVQNQIGNEEKQVKWWEKVAYLLQLRLTFPLSVAILISYFIVNQQLNHHYINDNEIQAFLLNESQMNPEFDLMELAYGENQTLIVKDDELIDYLDEDEIEHDIFLMMNNE